MLHRDSLAGFDPGPAIRVEHCIPGHNGPHEVGEQPATNGVDPSAILPPLRLRLSSQLV